MPARLTWFCSRRYRAWPEFKVGVRRGLVVVATAMAAAAAAAAVVVVAVVCVCVCVGGLMVGNEGG